MSASIPWLATIRGSRPLSWRTIAAAAVPSSAPTSHSTTAVSPPFRVVKPGSDSRARAMAHPVSVGSTRTGVSLPGRAPASILDRTVSAPGFPGSRVTSSSATSTGTTTPPA